MMKLLLLVALFCAMLVEGNLRGGDLHGHDGDVSRELKEDKEKNKNDNKKDNKDKQDKCNDKNKSTFAKLQFVSHDVACYVFVVSWMDLFSPIRNLEIFRYSSPLFQTGAKQKSLALQTLALQTLAVQTLAAETLAETLVETLVLLSSRRSRCLHQDLTYAITLLWTSPTTLGRARIIMSARTSRPEFRCAALLRVAFVVAKPRRMKKVVADAESLLVNSSAPVLPDPVSSYPDPRFCRSRPNPYHRYRQPEHLQWLHLMILHLM
jgi:hypothetical protein